MKLFVSKNFWVSTVISIVHFVSFVVVLFTYLFILSLRFLVRFKYIPKPVKLKMSKISAFLYDKATPKDVHGQSSISRINLIDLAFSSMKYKKARTAITIGGMSIGVATIIFLISIGFGLERLVTSKIARLDEMKQADVSTQAGSNMHIDDRVLSDFNEISGVKYVLPQISLVAKIRYKSSVSDMAVYGVTSEYLKQSAVKPVKGKIFDSDELAFGGRSIITGEVAGVSDSREYNFGDEIGAVEYSIYPNEWIKVRSKPSITADVIGYTRRYEGHNTGIKVKGDRYIADQKSREVKSAWIKSKVYIWEKTEDGEYKKLLDEHGNGVQKDGYFAIINMSTINVAELVVHKPSILGVSDSKVDDANKSSMKESTVQESTQEALLASTEKDNDLKIIDSGDGWVKIEGLGVANDSGKEIKKISISDRAYKQAVVNRAMLNILGIDENNAIGEEFDASFVVNGDLIGKENREESEFTTYEIVAVIPQNDVPYFYVPLVDLKSLGIINYSQAKVVSEDEKSLSVIRKKIEAMGFNSSSVTDTVEQVNALFRTIRTVFAMLGAVALAVASLGMFNTLTVSLLERTREIGLMKSMGMKSREVKELFLTESMIMGFLGGVLGIIFGFLVGKLVGLVLTLIAIQSGFGFIDVSYIPLTVTLIVLGLSLLVGIVTGFYPAKRAKSISALNALRYE